MQTSFKRNARGTGTTVAHPISGTQRSLHNGQLLCSSGVPSLDSVLGGGIPIGSVLMIEEDSNDQYASLLTRYFVAEGILAGNGIFTISHEAVETQVHRLPEPIFTNKDPTNLSQERLKIAWRYQALPQMNSSFGQPSDYGHHYDISKPMNLARLRKCDYTSLNLKEAYLEHRSGEFNMLQCVMKKIHQYILDNDFGVKDGKQPSNLLRVLIPNFGSPLWGKLCSSDIVQFLLCLRTLIRNSLAVCVLSSPTHIQDEAVVQLMRHHVDTVIGLTDFGMDKRNPLYKEYHGLLKIHKLPILNTLLPVMPDTLDLAFKLRRKKFSIERLHLPPDIAETAQHKSDRHTGVETCTSTHGPTLDF